jgi:hypothetical protein
MGAVTVATFRYRHEGELARGYLTDAGIASILSSDDAGLMRPDVISMHPVRLMVDAGDAERAREVLDTSEESDQKNGSSPDGP